MVATFLTSIPAISLLKSPWFDTHIVINHLYCKFYGTTILNRWRPCSLKPLIVRFLKLYN